MRTHMELVGGSYRVEQNLYHFEWCTKYRYMFRKKIENFVKKFLEKLQRNMELES
jgi:hypothetical protein